MYYFPSMVFMKSPSLHENKERKRRTEWRRSVELKRLKLGQQAKRFDWFIAWIWTSFPSVLNVLIVGTRLWNYYLYFVVQCNPWHNLVSFLFHIHCNITMEKTKLYLGENWTTTYIYRKRVFWFVEIQNYSVQHEFGLKLWLSRGRKLSMWT